MLRTLTVAEIRKGLFASASLGAVDRSETGSTHRLIFEMAEGFPGAFKTSRQETAGDRRVRGATRLMLQLSYLPTDAEVWACYVNVPPFPAAKDAKLSATLVSANALGEWSPPETLETTSFAVDPMNHATAARLSTGHGIASAVWEIDSTSAGANCARRLRFAVFIRLKLNISTEIQWTVSFAPLSTTTTPGSFREVVPRFIPSLGPRHVRLDG